MEFSVLKLELVQTITITQDVDCYAGSYLSTQRQYLVSDCLLIKCREPPFHYRSKSDDGANIINNSTSFSCKITNVSFDSHHHLLDIISYILCFCQCYNSCWLYRIVPTGIIRLHLLTYCSPLLPLFFGCNQEWNRARPEDTV